LVFGWLTGWSSSSFFLSALLARIEKRNRCRPDQEKHKNSYLLERGTLQNEEMVIACKAPGPSEE
jgi:hypothetical protein